jgi:hypothetical protein
MRGRGMRGNASTCQRSGEKEARPAKGPRMVGDHEHESMKGEEDAGLKRVCDLLDTHSWGTRKARSLHVAMGHPDYHHIPMPYRNVNYRAMAPGPARDPAHQPTGSRNRERPGNHLRYPP